MTPVSKGVIGSEQGSDCPRVIVRRFKACVRVRVVQ